MERSTWIEVNIDKNELENRFLAYISNARYMLEPKKLDLEFKHANQLTLRIVEDKIKLGFALLTADVDDDLAELSDKIRFIIAAFSKFRERLLIKMGMVGADFDIPVNVNEEFSLRIGLDQKTSDQSIVSPQTVDFGEIQLPDDITAEHDEIPDMNTPLPGSVDLPDDGTDDEDAIGKLTREVIIEKLDL